MNGLKYTTVGRLAFSKPDIIELDSNGSLKEALELLRINRILSVPVYESESRMYLGVLTILDLMIYIAFYQFKEDHILPKRVDNWAFKETKVGNLVGLNDTCKNKTNFRFVESSANMEECLRFLDAGVPRLLVSLGYDQEENMKPLVRLVSTTDFVRYLKTFLSSSTNELRFMRKPLFSLIEKVKLEHFHTCSITDTITIEAFRALHKHHADAIALVSNDGKLKGTLSPSDLRHLYEGDEFAFNDILLTAQEYLQKSHGGEIRESIVVKMNVPFEEALKIIVDNKVHRVWIVNEHQEPVGCLRLQDVVNIVLNHLK